MAIEIVDLPINSMVDLSIVFCSRLPGRVPVVYGDHDSWRSTPPKITKTNHGFLQNPG